MWHWWPAFGKARQEGRQSGEDILEMVVLSICVFVSNSSLVCLDCGSKHFERTCYQTEAAHCKASISGRGRPQGICVELNDQSPGGNVENSPKRVRGRIKPGRRWVPELLAKQGGADHHHLGFG